MNVADLLSSLISLSTLLVAVLVYGFAPGFVLRLLVLLYPRQDPRRAELIAELYEVPRLTRPFWVAEQIETAVFDGLGARFRSARQRRRSDDVSPDLPLDVPAAEALGQHTALVGVTGTGKSTTMKKIIDTTAALSQLGGTINGEPGRPVGQIVFDVHGEYANPNLQDGGAAFHTQYCQDVARYSMLAKPGFKIMRLDCPRTMAEIVARLRAGKIVILDLSDVDIDIQRTCTGHVSKAILDDAMVQFVQQRRAKLIQMYFEEAHNLLRHEDSQDLTEIYDRLAGEGPKFGIGICYATQDVECIPDRILQNTHKCFTLHRNYSS